MFCLILGVINVSFTPYSRIQEYKNTRIQDYNWIQAYKNSRIQEYKNTRLQDNNTRIQDIRIDVYTNTRIQEYNKQEYKI